MTSNTRTLLITGLLILAAAVASYFYAEHRTATGIAAYQETFRAELDEALDRQATAIAQLSRRFETVDDLKTAQERQLTRTRNADHVAMARARGVGRVTGEDDIQQLLADERLVALTDTQYYHVQELDYSVPYVTPDAAALLQLIGERLHDKLAEHDLPRYRYVISSGLRTGDNQRALRQINPNATSGVSSHEFGTTLDIVYHKYRYGSLPEDRLPDTPYPFLNDRLETLRVQAYDALGMRYWQELQGILGRVLIELQAEGKVLVILERGQPVFHITVADDF